MRTQYKRKQLWMKYHLNYSEVHKMLNEEVEQRHAEFEDRGACVVCGSLGSACVDGLVTCSPKCGELSKEGWRLEQVTLPDGRKVWAPSCAVDEKFQRKFARVWCE